MLYKKRDSSIEAFRIAAMLCIVMSHYVVNSGLLNQVRHDNLMTAKSIVTLLLGSGGKTGINCFVLITGYYMCKSQISVKKYIKLWMQILFYNVGIGCIFILTGYEHFSLQSVKMLLPFYGVGSAFVPSFMVFYLFIPFLNILIKSMTEYQHKVFIGISLGLFCILQTFFFVEDAVTYVGWFAVIYMVAAYIRCYPKPVFQNRVLFGWLTAGTVLLSAISVLVCIVASWKTGRTVYYWFVSDANKIMALATALCSFLFFKNLHIQYSTVVNRFAGATFGVLLIHANSGTMSRWLWNDIFHIQWHFQSGAYYLHLVVTVAVVFLVCAGIDMLRQIVVERPLLKLYDRLDVETKVKCLIYRAFRVRQNNDE